MCNKALVCEINTSTLQIVQQNDMQCKDHAKHFEMHHGKSTFTLKKISMAATIVLMNDYKCSSMSTRHAELRQNPTLLLGHFGVNQAQRLTDTFWHRAARITAGCGWGICLQIIGMLEPSAVVFLHTRHEHAMYSAANWKHDDNNSQTQWFLCAHLKTSRITLSANKIVNIRRRGDEEETSGKFWTQGRSSAHWISAWNR